MTKEDKMGAKEAVISLVETKLELSAFGLGTFKGIILENNNPKYVVTNAIEIITDRGPVVLFESEPISLSRDSEDNLYIGDGGTVLKLVDKTALHDLFTNISPASFGLILEEDGEISLKATLTKEAPELKDGSFGSVATVSSIRRFGVRT